MRRASTIGFAFASFVASYAALAQEPQYQPLPPPQPPPPGYGQPPPQYPSPQPPYQPPPQPYQPPPPGYGQPPPQQPYYGQPPPQRQPSRQPPPPVEYVEPESPTHAPKYSLWMGPRLSYLGFGFSFFGNRSNHSETTGNFVGNGVAPQLDLGARISYRYIPHVFWEHGFLAKGHRFEGDSASASTDFYGIGFRYLGGDVDSVSFLSEISIGKRVVSVTNGGQTYTMTGLEFFKLGLGAEIRLHTLFSIEPVFSIAGGSLNDTSGTVKFSAEGSKDGITEPAFKNGETIENTRQYVMLSLGVGIHFDVFGK